MPSHRTLLLVDDEELVRNYLNQLLTKHAWTVTVAASGEEALARLVECDFNIVVCDLDLGRGPSGFDILQRMPSRNAGKPFVILTAHGSIGRCREAFLLGVVDFLEKPLDRALLLATLDQAVDGATATDEFDDIAPERDVLDLPYDAMGAAHVRGAIQTMECRFGEFDLTVAIVAKERGVSPEHLARLFHARIGHTPTEHLHEIRISHGEHLLAHSRMSVYEVALECGYRRTSEFGSWFRRLRGSPPSGRRKS